MADQRTDNLYAGIRQKFGQREAGANGYQMYSFFRREQRLLYSLLRPTEFPILDIACGSGLMLSPSLEGDGLVVGLDFNERACMDALANGLRVFRGDAFRLPLANDSVAQAINCQFLNQQTAENTQLFIKEVARVLKPGGQLVLFWRHADSLFHRVAGALVRTRERLTGEPVFPQFSHPLAETEVMLRKANLSVSERLVSVPFFYSQPLRPSQWAAGLVGASLVIVAEKAEISSGPDS